MGFEGIISNEKPVVKMTEAQYWELINSQEGKREELMKQLGLEYGQQITVEIDGQISEMITTREDFGTMIAKIEDDVIKAL